MNQGLDDSSRGHHWRDLFSILVTGRERSDLQVSRSNNQPLIRAFSICAEKSYFRAVGPLPELGS